MAWMRWRCHGFTTNAIRSGVSINSNMRENKNEKKTINLLLLNAKKSNNWFQEFWDSTSQKDERNKTRSKNDEKNWPKVEVPDDFVIPEPQPLRVTRSSDLPSLFKSSLALALRLGTGAFVLGWKVDTLFFEAESDSQQKYYLALGGPIRLRDSSSVLDQAPRPQKPLILYEYDASPFCKRVRETINLLDLTVEYRPCPGARQGYFSDQLYQRTGRRTVPYLIDPNTDIELFESDDQIQYLLDTYGPSNKDLYDLKALWPITFLPFSLLTSTLAAIIRDMPGSQRQPNARPDNEQMKPLQLWGYECSPFVRPVREKLSSLCLPHQMISSSRGSANRDLLVLETGRFQVPYLEDPNTGIQMFEGPEIVDYLESVYTVQSKSA